MNQDSTLVDANRVMKIKNKQEIYTENAKGMW